MKYNTTHLACGRPSERTAIKARASNRLGATVRFNDEKEINSRTTLTLYSATDETTIMNACVVYCDVVPTWKAMDIINDCNAIYGSDTTTALLNSLNEHYDKGIHPYTNVKVIVYKPKEL